MKNIFKFLSLLILFCSISAFSIPLEETPVLPDIENSISMEANIDVNFVNLSMEKPENQIHFANGSKIEINNFDESIKGNSPIPNVNWFEEATTINKDAFKELKKSVSEREFLQASLNSREYLPQDKFDRLNQINDKLLQNTTQNKLQLVLDQMPDNMETSEMEFILNNKEYNNVKHLLVNNKYKDIPVKVEVEAPNELIYLLPKRNSKYF